MTTAIPTVVRQMCSLSADELQDRLAMIRRDILPHVKRTEVLPNGFICEFDQHAEFQSKLEDLVALERTCCGGLTFDLQSLPGANTLRLTVTGADPHSGIFEPFGGPAGPAR